MMTMFILKTVPVRTKLGSGKLRNRLLALQCSA